jgi:hypothetical protein
MLTIFSTAAAVFWVIGIAWAYFAIKAMLARRWTLSSMRAFVAATYVGVVVFLSWLAALAVAGPPSQAINLN